MLAAMLTGVTLVLCGCGGMTIDEAKDYVKSALMLVTRQNLKNMQK